MQSPLFYDDVPYRVVIDGDPQAREIVERHYSRRWRGKPGTGLFIGPGTKLALIGVDGDWVFIWRRSLFRLDGQTGAECVVFRNEGTLLSSQLVAIAELAWDRQYGPTRKYTYVNPRLIRSSNPGYCFLKADWTRQPGRSTRGLILLTKEVACAS